MTDKQTPVRSQEERQADLAPEMHNDEQDDHRSQAQEIAMQAQEHANNVAGATEGLKVASPGIDNVAGSETDMINKMREMEDSGKIDTGAYAGEPNHDDNVDKYDAAD